VVGFIYKLESRIERRGAEMNVVTMSERLNTIVCIFEPRSPRISARMGADGYGGQTLGTPVHPTVEAESAGWVSTGSMTTVLEAVRG
jgi:hypothetical protein